MSIQHPDHAEYRHFTARQRIDKAVHSLAGMIGGIVIDDAINAKEIAELLNWVDDYRDLVSRAPFNELLPLIERILADGVIDPEEQEDLLWACKNLSIKGDYYNDVTHDIQTLHGILHGILADGHLSEDEVRGLQLWVDEHLHLKGTYPYEELDSLLMSVLADGVIDATEQELLKNFFEDFVQYSFATRVDQESTRVSSGLPKKISLPGVCSSCPDIKFDGRVFTFTGSSMKAPRKELVAEVAKRNGQFSPNVTQATDFLVVGSAGNPCWAFSCYGRKVEQAVNFRKKGQPILIIHENDFWDAIRDTQC